jgi:dTDP-4-dehydrorhamnose 3,5-epimerase
MKIAKTPIPDLLLIQPRVFADERGFFLETFRRRGFEDQGIGQEFVQDNHSRSRKGVLRGLHFQKNHPQGKLIYVISGAIFDVALDLRRESPSFGRWHGAVLSDENHHQLWIPPGFAHGFCVISEQVDLVYKCTDYYHPEDEGGIIWNDPELKIEWPIANPIVSEKDSKNPTLRAIEEDSQVLRAFSRQIWNDTRDLRFATISSEQ